MRASGSPGAVQPGCHDRGAYQRSSKACINGRIFSHLDMWIGERRQRGRAEKTTHTDDVMTLLSFRH